MPETRKTFPPRRRRRQRAFPEAANKSRGRRFRPAFLIIAQHLKSFLWAAAYCLPELYLHLQRPPNLTHLTENPKNLQDKASTLNKR